MAIITAAQYKTYAGISDTTLDARLAVLIPALQDEVERYCGRVFDTATFIEKLDGTGTDSLLVRNPPIASITSIVVNHSASSSTTLDSADYGFSLREDGRIWFIGSDMMRRGLDDDGTMYQPAFGHYPAFPVGRENITVTYVGGYGSGVLAMPTALQLLMYRVVDDAVGQTRLDRGLTSENLGRYGYTRAAPPPNGQLNAHQLAWFNAWRRISL